LLLAFHDRLLDTPKTRYRRKGGTEGYGKSNRAVFAVLADGFSFAHLTEGTSTNLNSSFDFVRGNFRLMVGVEVRTMARVWEAAQNAIITQH